MAKLKMPVTERALVQRINRALAKKQEVLKKSRREDGGYFHIDTDRNFAIETDVDVEKMGRELGVLKPYESLER